MAAPSCRICGQFLEMSLYVGHYLWGIIVACSLFPTILTFFLEVTQNCAVLQLKFAMALRLPGDAGKQVSDQLTGFLRSALSRGHRSRSIL